MVLCKKHRTRYKARELYIYLVVYTRFQFLGFFYLFCNIILTFLSMIFLFYHFFYDIYLAHICVYYLFKQ